MMERDKRAKVEVAPYDSLVGGQVLVSDHVRKIAEPYHKVSETS